VALSHLCLNRAMSALVTIRLDAARRVLPELASFYSERLSFPVVVAEDGRVAVEVGETRIEWRAAGGEAFYHVALLVPGDRFEEALAWAAERVEFLPERETGEVVFDFAFWDALACYFHDPAGSIVELIAHRGIGEAGSTGPFRAEELLGVSEVGIVGDPPEDAVALATLGLEVWDGTVEGERSLAFVGEQARTLILCRAGRPWLPTGRPAEPWPMEVVVAGEPAGEVDVGAGSRVRRAGSTAVQAS
jgi:hypothetical protein